MPSFFFGDTKILGGLDGVRSRLVFLVPSESWCFDGETNGVFLSIATDRSTVIESTADNIPVPPYPPSGAIDGPKSRSDCNCGSGWVRAAG